MSSDDTRAAAPRRNRSWTATACGPWNRSMTNEPTGSNRPGTDPAVSVVGPDGGEVLMLGPTKFRILADGSTTGPRLGLAESVLPPNTPGPPQHRHAQHDEGFYIVSGSVRFTVGR